MFCCSAMSKQESSKVKQLAKALGAVVENSWSERCSHLIMTGITVTVKVAEMQTCACTHTHTHTRTHTHTHTHTYAHAHTHTHTHMHAQELHIIFCPSHPPLLSPSGSVCPLQLQASHYSSMGQRSHSLSPVLPPPPLPLLLSA